MRSILDAKTFKYTPSASTDIRKTFARERKRQADEAKARAASSVATLPVKRAAQA